MREAWENFRGAFTPARGIAIAVLMVLVAVAVFAPLIAPADPLAQDIARKLLPPGSDGYLLGSDALGRDVLSRLMHGARVEFVVALGATVVAVAIGTLIGLAAGYFRGLPEIVGMRLVELIVAFPPIIFALLIITLYSSSQATLIFVIGLLFSPQYARLTYGQTLLVRKAEYVEAATVFGAPTSTRIFRVILPNVAPVIFVQLPITIASTILLESGLSFLGLGIVPPAPSWGGMVAEGQRFMATEPSLLIVSGSVIVVAVLTFGVVGDMLRDAFDPRFER